MQSKAPSNTDRQVFLSRRDYQEILLVRLAGGDLYAMETLQKFRRVDMMLDRLRIANGDNPLYPASQAAGRNAVS